MVRLPPHVAEQIEELVSRIVSPVLEDHGAPEEDVKPLTHGAPGGALPPPMRLDNARDIPDGDAVYRDAAHSGKHVALKIASPRGLSQSTAPRALARLDDHLEKLAHGRRTTLAPAMGDRVNAPISEAQMLHGLLTSGAKAGDRETPKTEIPPSTVDDQPLNEGPATARTHVQVQAEPIAMPPRAGLLADALCELVVSPLSR